MRIDVRAVASALFAAAAITFGYGTSALAQDGTIHVQTGSLTGHSCDASEWHFIINQLSEGQAPASIMVFWGASSATVDLTKTSGPTAHYSTTANLGVPVTDATAVIVGDWRGQFVLSHGPCFTATAAAPTVTGQGASDVDGTTTGQAATATQGQVAVAGVQTAPQQGAATGQATQRAVGGQQTTPLQGVGTLPSTSTNGDANLLASPVVLGIALTLGVALLGFAVRRLATHPA